MTSFIKNTSELIEFLRSNGVVITEELCRNVASRCQEIFKTGLEEGSRIAISQYESTFVLKLKEISTKLKGQPREIIEALYESIEENVKD